MKERITVILSSLSLLLCFVVIVSWARSITDYESIVIGDHLSGYTLSASSGAIFLTHGRYTYDSPEIERAWKNITNTTHSPDWDRLQMGWSHEDKALDWLNNSVLGFGYASSVTNFSRRIMVPGIHLKTAVIQVPHWALALLTGLAPGIWLYKRHQLQRGRSTQGLCRKCGFEIGNVYHCCPKCGERAPLPEGFPVT